MNPLVKMMAQQAVGNMPQMQMLQQFNDFRAKLGNQNPQEIINGLMQSGKITAEQLEQAKAMAQQMQGLFK